jgi:outer membrane protein assembly factor BamE
MPESINRNPLLVLALLASLALSACSGKLPGVYRVPVQQGNVITVEMLQKLELGMDKRKVNFILGTPLVTDAFHLDRWDYFYSYEPGSGAREQQRASLYFEDDRLARIDADINSQLDFRTVTKANENVLIVPPKKKGFFAALTPGFVEREQEAEAQEELARALDTGFNDPQPGAAVNGGTGDAGEVLDSALAAPAVIGPSLDGGTAPNEVYAPNAFTGIEAGSTWSTQPGSGPQVISAETEDQSRYLEQLFDDFGTASTPGPAESPVSKQAASQPVVSESRDVTQPGRD